ncbi:hypothetical protein [Longimicrobium sp.]|uniref:hypothetical protein n=1 Tax=Longimicrobium sp. TaxID=2029185 RepID=UPI002F9350F4
MRETEHDVRLFRPADRNLAMTDQRHLEAETPHSAKGSVREREWVGKLVPGLQRSLQAADPTLELRDGYRLAYSREVLRYREAEPLEQFGMLYETDLLIVERAGNDWTPRVVIEAKMRSVTTHDAITYSQKAATHKHVHPYLRYGIFLGYRGKQPLPGRLFRHGAHFDFMISWQGLEPTMEEFEQFTALLIDEVRASRLLQEIMFGTRRRERARYSVLHKPVIAK